MPKRARLLLPMVAVALVPLAGLAPAAASPVADAAPAPTPIAIPVVPVEVRDAPGDRGPDSIPAPRASSRTALTPGTASAATSTFVVDYDAGFNANPKAKAAFQAAVDVWASHLSSPVPITVKATFSPLEDRVLGSAGPGTILTYPGSNIAVPIAIDNKLKGADQCGSPKPSWCESTYDIHATFSSSFPDFYFETDGNTPWNKSDFMSVVLHELGHGLGFVSSARPLGATLGYPVQGGVTYFFPLDKLMRNGAGLSVLNVAPNLVPAMLTSGNLWATGTATAAANGGPVRMYAPNPYESGSSIAHLDEDTYDEAGGEALMTPIIERGEHLLPGPVGLAMLQDMGWSVNPTGGTVTGTVTPPQDSSAQGVTVELYSGTTVARKATVGAGGTFSLPNVAPGQYKIRYVDPLDRFVERWFPSGTSSNDATPVTVDVGLTVTANQTLAWPSPSRFVGVAPTRLLDTRTGPVPNGFTTGKPLAAGKHIDLTVTGGTANVPSTATAVVLTVTATDVAESSFVTVWPTGSPRPNASSLNPAAGTTTPNLVTVKVGAGGKVSLYNNSGGVALVADIVGYYVPLSAGTGDGFAPVSPTRLFDTRTGPDASGHTRGTKLVGPKKVDITVTGGTANVPGNATAVVLNVTTTGATAGSYLTLYPAGTTQPTASSANPQPGMTTANLVAVKVGTGGKVSLYNFHGGVDVIVDIVGWFGPTGTSAFVPRSPQRLLDTRGGPVPVGPVAPLGANANLTLPVADKVNVPGTATGAVFNLTATGATADGFLTAYPQGVTRPVASSINPAPGRTLANLSATKLGGGNILIYNLAGKVDVLADLTGYYVPMPV